MIFDKKIIAYKYYSDPNYSGRRTVLAGSANDSDFGYTGHFTHPATGLALAPYRGYDATIGRWLSRDPLGEAGGVNLYAYVGGNPVNYTDPLGLSPDYPLSTADEAQPLQCGLKDYCQPPKGLRGWARAAFLAWCLANNKRPPPEPPPPPKRPPVERSTGPTPKPGGGTPPDDLPPIPPTTGS